MVNNVRVEIGEKKILLHTQHGTLTTEKSDRTMSLESAAIAVGYPASLVENVLVKNGYIKPGSPVETHWLAMLHLLIDEKALAEWQPTSFREEAWKYMKQLSILRHSSKGNALYGDYRVHEFFADLVDLIDHFVHCDSYTRIIHTPEEIFNQIQKINASDDAVINWDRLEGNFDSDDALELYKKITDFRVYRQGKEVYIGCVADRLRNWIEDEYPECTITSTPTDDDMLLVTVEGPKASSIFYKIRNDYRIVQINSNKCYIVF